MDPKLELGIQRRGAGNQILIIVVSWDLSFIPNTEGLNPEKFAIPPVIYSKEWMPFTKVKFPLPNWTPAFRAGSIMLATPIPGDFERTFSIDSPGTNNHRCRGITETKVSAVSATVCSVQMGDTQHTRKPISLSRRSGKALS